MKTERAIGRVTVVIRTRNCEDTLGQVLAALHSQDYRLFDVMAVDSGSTDSTLDILRSYDVPTKRIDGDSYQPGPVLNSAVAECDTPFVVFLNSDTVPLRRDALRRLLDAMTNEKAAAAWARQVPRPEAEPWVVRDYAVSFPPEPPAPEWMYLSLPFAVIRRSVWLEHPFYDDAWASEDTEWGKWAMEHGYEVIYVPEAIVMHSHNYTLRQLWGRKFVEGEADAFIHGARPAPGRMLRRILASGLRDALLYLRMGRPLGALWAPVRRAVYHAAWEAGCRLGRRRLEQGVADASVGRRVVLSSYDG